MYSNKNISRNFLVFKNQLRTMNIRTVEHAVESHAIWINDWQSITYQQMHIHQETIS